MKKLKAYHPVETLLQETISCHMPYRYIENCRYPRLYLNKSIDYFSYRYRNNTIAHALSIPGRDVEVNIHVFLRSMTWEIYSCYPEVTNATTYLLRLPTTGIYEKGKKCDQLPTTPTT